MKLLYLAVAAAAMLMSSQADAHWHHHRRWHHRRHAVHESIKAVSVNLPVPAVAPAAAPAPVPPPVAAVVEAPIRLVKVVPAPLPWDVLNPRPKVVKPVPVVHASPYGMLSELSFVQPAMADEVLLQRARKLAVTMQPKQVIPHYSVLVWAQSWGIAGFIGLVVACSSWLTPYLPTFSKKKAPRPPLLIHEPFKRPTPTLIRQGPSQFGLRLGPAWRYVTGRLTHSDAEFVVASILGDYYGGRYEG